MTSPVRLCATIDTIAITKNATKRTLPIMTALAAIPPKPKTAATSANTKKTTAQYNMTNSFRSDAMRIDRSKNSTLGAKASLACCAVLALGCSESWHTGPTVLADPRDVAAALGDPPPNADAAVADLPHLGLPHHDRFCCAFGMDMQVDFAGMHVPFFQVSNVISTDQLGDHVYDLPSGTIDGEPNGLIYTCRGGWIDTAHVREDADLVLYLALAMAPTLATGTTIEIPGRGAPTTVVIAPVPADLLRREGALTIASELASWAAFRISVWHEVSTWYGYQSVAGFSERPSAFSLEDLYSNELGIHLARAILDEHGFHDQSDYDHVIAAFLEEALIRLDAQPLETSRAIMGALDGRWWDSTERLPDNHLVRRRHFPPDGGQLTPWRAEDAFGAGDVPEPLASACRGAETRPLSLTTHVGRVAPRELVTITWAPEGWADATFPFADPARRIVEERDLDRIVAEAHAGLEADLGAGFDQPGPLPN